jgi:hypothetical protein
MELFNWEARWESDVVPLLDHPKVKDSIAWFKRLRDEMVEGMRQELTRSTDRVTT